MGRPLVSIITPAYNQAQFIGHCIESVRAQTYNDWEQIIVDDGSSDGTPDIVEGFGDPRIRCIRLPHRGLAALAQSYNAGLSACNGELIAVLEGDDAWPSRKLDIQLPMFEDPDIYLTWGRAKIIDETDRPLGEFSTITTRKPYLRLSNRELFHRLTRMNVLAPSLTVMARRDALDRAGGFRQNGTSLYADLPTWLRLSATSSGAGCFINEILGCYRVHGDQTTHRFQQEMSTDHIHVVRSVVEGLSRDQLSRLEWNDDSRKRAEFSGILAEGVRLLRAKDQLGARRAFLRSLQMANSPADFAKTTMGLLSCLVRFDLLTAMYDLRIRAGSWLRRRLARH